ncbi:hypothetical protein GOFOIKOB_3000 [Methylobacterium tardum]|uniref:Uncharacterized protein n=1 Tax=Methylobacterium tardum TaxID=374432 RepID=A0AA37WQK0_9HYPH|nr:helix-turn-helix domain-containing protein [Methylobacterium tardum]URD38344.1 helix-turn-helix domain-containing protein [Methylobacterium tardum]GJE49959.1 hypothetical protein GOFOIKOB_3000 [Methylobacterium tardum]GLS70165.1 hypothetical protein GCM10007890_21780 [Methylobacterium tardum]
MSPENPIRRKPGRKSIVAAHPQRDAIEAACAAGISLRKVAHRFGLPRMALYRYWHSLPAEHRNALFAEAADLDDARWREVTTGLAAIARRHPEVRADLDELVQRISIPVTSSTTGGHAHAA